MEATFKASKTAKSPDALAEDAGNLIFPADLELDRKLEDPRMGLCHQKHGVWQFIQRHTADEAKEMVECPPDKYKQATIRAVQRMCCGGCTDYNADGDMDGATPQGAEEERLVGALFAKMLELKKKTVKKYEITRQRSKLGDLGITGHIGGRKKAGAANSRWGHVVKAISAASFPWLRVVGDAGGEEIRKLDVDMHKVNDMMEEEGEMLGKLSNMKNVWTWKEALQQRTPCSYVDDVNSPPGCPAHRKYFAGQLYESADVVALQGMAITEPEY
eukprot:gene3363-9076_t